MDRAEEHDVAESARDQDHAAEDEGAHEDLAQLGVGLQEEKKIIAADLDDFARLGSPNGHESAPPGQQVHLAGEVARAVGGYELLAAGGVADDFEAGGQDQKERVLLLPRFDEHFAALYAPLPATSGNARDLFRRQRRKHLLLARRRGR